jgi:hypothetical protein
MESSVGVLGTPVVVICLPRRWWLQRRLLHLGLSHMSGKDCCDGPCNLILHLENIVDLTIIALGPTVSAGLGVEELRADTDTIAAPANAAFQDITDVEFAPRLPDVNSSGPLPWFWGVKKT